MFAETGRGLLNSLREALVNGEIPSSLRNLVGGSVAEVQAAIMQIEDEANAAERRAAERGERMGATQMMQAETKQSNKWLRLCGEMK